MRSVLTVLLAFAAGALLMLWLSGHSNGPPLASPASAMTAASPAASSEPARSASGTDSANDASADDWPDNAPSPEQVLYAQPRMVHQALAALTPRVAGKPNLYLLTFAGDGSEDVFRNEAEYAARLFAQRFGASAHTLVLENNPASLTTHPLASWSNLELALDGLSKRMHPDQDILMLYATSHGDEAHDLLVDMDPLPLDQLGAADLAGILAEHRFRWKVVVVNACYSGGFMPPLEGPGTLVMAAARSDRSSFGCGNDSDITYFGKAWLVDGLNHSADFVTAFQQARSEIAGWEQRDGLTPSQPQIFIGSGITRQLARWRKGFRAGPTLPFSAIMPASVSSAALTP